MKDFLFNDFYEEYEKLKTTSTDDYFSILIEALYKYYGNLWESCSDKLPKELYSIYSNYEKNIKVAETEVFLKTFAEKYTKLDSHTGDKYIEEEINNNITSYINNSGFFKSKISADYPKDFIKNTNIFISKTHNYDDILNFYDIFQALRNVWTMSIFQSIYNKPIDITPSIFAYSLLYPYTDNMLDSRQITLSEKKFFSLRLKKRLEGEILIPVNRYEEKTFNLVTLIENEFERKDFYALYKSLLFLHNFQSSSLKQQTTYDKISLDEIKALSFKKGGLSVLTDAFLIKGNLNMDEIIFSFGLGVILQLLDDLQDIKADYKNKNSTLYTAIKDKAVMDTNTIKLLNFIPIVLERLKCNNVCYKDNIVQSLKDNAVLLILFSISRNSNLYSKSFIERIQTFYPFTPKYMKNFNRNLQQKYKKLRPLKNISISDILNCIET